MGAEAQEVRLSVLSIGPSRKLLPFSQCGAGRVIPPANLVRRPVMRRAPSPPLHRGVILLPRHTPKCVGGEWGTLAPQRHATARNHP
jgi:hypothetical protein